MIDLADIRSRYRQAEEFLDERGRRLFAANEALALGHGGVTATAKATSLARSTINRGIRELRSGSNDIGSRVRRPGGGRNSTVAHQPGLPAALKALIEDAIRGDPRSPLRWVSRSLRHLVTALAAQGFERRRPPRPPESSREVRYTLTLRKAETPLANGLAVDSAGAASWTANRDKT